MTETNIKPIPALTLDQPAQYRIEIQGQLDKSWSTNFGGMTIFTQKIPGNGTSTTLQGTVADQATLHGILNSIRDLGLPLLKVEYLLAEETNY
jgi:hypothetical protein